MAEVLLFHHAQGLTPGIISFADTVRNAGHIVHTPDLFEGRTFDSLEQGMSFVREVGFGNLVERGVQAAEGMPTDLVYAGFSLGVVPAQMLAQTRATARGALLFYSCVPVSEFGSSWPKGCRCKCMGWTPIRFLSMRATLMLLGHLLKQPTRQSCFSTLVISTTSPTVPCRRTTRRRRRC